MNRIQRSAWVAIGLGVGLLAGAAARDLLPRAQAQSSGSSEYQTIAIAEVLKAGSLDEEKADKLLNRFAKEGWRYGGTIATDGKSSLIVFERPSAGRPRTPARSEPARKNPEEID